MSEKLTVLVTGGAGYVGSILVPKLLSKQYKVRVVDLYLFEKNLFSHCRLGDSLEEIQGDIRDQNLITSALKNVDVVIHLACIANDPSYELNPELGKSINYDALCNLVKIAKDSGVKRFIYASSSSVYGIKEEENVTEEVSLEPLTDYSKYKALGEEFLFRNQSEGFTTVAVRSATVCGYSPRQRLDLVVNILTNLAVNTGSISVFGGEQKRPNIHIEDLTDLYTLLVEIESSLISGQAFNVGAENHKVSELAGLVQKHVGQENVKIVQTPTDDNRSYHICSDKIKNVIGFTTRKKIDDAIIQLSDAIRTGLLTDTLNNRKYFNVKMVSEHMENLLKV
tara:strand:- start:20235 stop:21248 length:1014 start_codon:yes stop_codon:yes gene_type:complete